MRAAEPGRRLATLHPWERLPRHPPAPTAPHPRSPLCRPQKARVSGQALVQTLRQLPPGWRAADASGGPARRPPRSPCTAQGPAQPGRTPEPGPALPWRASALAAALGPGLLGGRGHTATMPQGEVRLAPRRLLGPQTSSRLQQADTVSSGVWRPGAGLRGQGSGSGSQGSCLGLRSSPAQTTDPGFSPASHQRKSRWLGGSHSEGQGPQRSGAPHPVEGGANPPLRDWVDDRLLGRPPFHFRRWAVLPGADTPACRANLAHCLSV